MLTPPNFQLDISPVRSSEQKLLIVTRFKRLLAPFFTMVDSKFNGESCAIFMDGVRAWLVANFDVELKGGDSLTTSRLRALFGNQWEWFKHQAVEVLREQSEMRQQLSQLAEYLLSERANPEDWPPEPWDWNYDYGDFIPDRRRLSQFPVRFLLEEFSAFLREDLPGMFFREAGYIVSQTPDQNFFQQGSYFPICKACGAVYPAGSRNTDKNVCSDSCNGLLQRLERSADKQRYNRKMQEYRSKHR